MLLAHATQQSPAEPMVWAALVYREMSLLQNEPAKLEAMGGQMVTAIYLWRSLQPTNAAPLYLAAAFECLRSNFSNAQRLMSEADRKESFETFSPVIRECVTQAMESAGRSKDTAGICAMGQALGVVNWSKLSKTILAERSEDQEAIRSCLVLGDRVGRGKEFLRTTGWGLD